MATVRMAPMSEPASGSEIEIAMRVLPDSSLGIQRFDLLRRSLAHDIEAAEHAAGKGHEEVGAGVGDLLGDHRHSITDPPRPP